MTNLNLNVLLNDTIWKVIENWKRNGIHFSKYVLIIQNQTFNLILTQVINENHLSKRTIELPSLFFYNEAVFNRTKHKIEK